MKILHFHPDGRMAVNFIDPLIKAERDYGYSSELITSTRKSKLSSVVLPYDISFQNLLVLPLVFFRICMLLRERRPDVVISHNTKSSPLPLLAAWIMGIKTRIYFNHGVPYVGYRGVLRSLLRIFEVFNCALSTRVVTVSPDMAELLLDVQQGVQPTMILNGSPCGIDLDLYDSDLFKGSKWRYENKIEENDAVVVYIGRPEKRKGFEHVLQLWNEYLIEPRYKLVICGASSVDVLKHLPVIPSNIICLGFVNNIPEVLFNADMLILPSLHEGLSYAVLEAMASNCVVIANDIEGVRHLIDDGKNGFLVQGNLLPIYANLIRSMVNDKERALNIKHNALATAATFSRNDFIPAYLEFLNQVAKFR